MNSAFFKSNATRACTLPRAPALRPTGFSRKVGGNLLKTSRAPPLRGGERPKAGIQEYFWDQYLAIFCFFANFGALFAL